MSAKQYEIAKVDEIKSLPVVRVVDLAVPPDRKSKPKRALIVIFSTFVAGVLVVTWVLLREFHGGAMKRHEYAERFGALRSHLRFRGESSGPG